MQKICAIILLTALASNFEALPQTKWSRPIRNSQGQLTRERRQFPFGEWIPLSQPCPTCRPFADPLDAGLRGENIGLTPPRPPTVTRQIHGEGNFFIQDESSILSVPPPPPSAIPRHPISNNNGNFQFSSFGQQFNTPLAVPTQKIFPQTQQIQFFPQTFSSNQPLLVNGNQQILPGLKAQNNLFGQVQNQQQVTNFNSEFKTQKAPENVVLEQNKRPTVPKQEFSNKPQPFTSSQQNQQQNFIQQQAFGGQQRLNFGNSILTPPPAPNNATQNIVIPGLDKEEIQLLYVPVETLRQRGTPQEQLLTQQPQNIQFFNRANGLQRPVNTVRPTEQTLVTQPKGHFVTQNGKNQGQTDSTLKVTSTQPFPTSVTPSNLLLQHLPFQQTPQPFVSATPATPTIQPFVTPASVFQKFSPFTPETTLPHLSTVPNTIQFSQSDIDFGTTPKPISNQEAFKEEIINGKTQFSGLKSTDLNQELQRPPQQPLQQSFVNQQQVVTQQPQLNTVFPQEQQKEVVTQGHFPHQIDQQQIALQKQQEQQRLLQQQRQKELEEQQFLEQQRKQKELEEKRLLQQQQQRQKELEQQRFLQKQKELEEQRLLQQQRQKELEQQRYLQKQKELEEQRLLQQRQKELEQQRFLQKQKELEEQRLLQQRQKELEEQRFLQEQRQKELENQRRLQLQKQKELEEKRRLQLKQKEEEQRLLRFQQQQKELEHQRLLQQQQEEEQRLLQQQKLQKQKQENLKKQQQFQYFQQQQQQQKQNFPQQVFQQQNRHVLPANDNLNFIPQPEKEVEPEDQLVPHQPPLSVFFKGYNGAEPRITDVLRELRSSGTITVLDQYFEKMPKVFVGPAGLIPPPGYGKFELPYLSNLESNRIERRIDKLPFFVAPLNFVPPPGYAKIPFPAPHVGSVVVSSESNPAMTLKSAEKGSSEEGSFPVVGPELPGLINNLDTTQTTTLKPTTYVSTPSLPQTTAQLRNRRPNSNLYKPQSRKPITRNRPTTTSKPEEEVTQPIQKTEVAKDSESGLRKPFNRFLNRRRQQAKTTTETPLRGQQDGKSLENRFYSVEVFHQEKNQLPRTQQKSDIIPEKKDEENRFNLQFKQHAGSIDRITPSGHGVFEVRPTPDYTKTSGETIEQVEGRPEIPDYADVNLQTFEDGPLPTGSAKTITQELYRPNTLNQPETNIRTLAKSDSTSTSGKYQPENYEGVSTAKLSEISDASPTVDVIGFKDTVSEGQVSIQPTSFTGTEKQDVSSERYDTTEIPGVSFTPNPVTASGEQHTSKTFLDSNEQYTSAFAEISKPHHIPGFTESSKQQLSKGSDVYPTPELSLDLQAPISQKQHSQEFDISSEVKPTQNSFELLNNKHATTGSSHEQYFTGFQGETKNEQPLTISTGQVGPTAPGATEGQYESFYVNQQAQNSHNSGEANRNSEDQRIGSFISLQGIQPTEDSPANPQQYFPSSTPFPSHTAPAEVRKDNEYPIIVEQSQPQVSSTPETGVEIAVNPSVQTYTSASSTESSLYINEQTQTTEGHGQEVANNFANDHRLKLPNPSIVRVRTRVRGKSRGQVNFAASQSTTPVPFTRSATENKHDENAENEFTTKVNHFRDYQALKTSKYNQYRGIKKPVRTTTEASTEYEHKANVYTIRPQRKPLNPSTVSTKRIRRPTTPIPSAEAATEAFESSTVGRYSQSEHSDISPSGVSNDVYYEQSSLSPVKHKLRKHFGSAEQKNDFAPAYISTSYPSAAPTYSPFAHDSYSEESYVSKELTQTVAPSDYSEKYPEWNPSESGFDVSGIVLTTTHTPDHEEQPEFEEPKKSQDSKKAFDPDLEKKTGRRRVRVRVHKRPHENFETAESQNLRTVANVLVPPTTTYKPNDESSIHQLAKNADFSFGGQKLFGLRSREYFRKRLNLTQPEGASNSKQEELSKENIQEVGETTEKTKILGFVRKVEKTQKNDFDSVSTQSSEGGEGNKLVRPKFRGFVRKIVKHGGPSKEADSESNQVHENEENEGKHETAEFHPRQPFRINGFNQTGRINGTRHKTLVRFVKKNKIRHHDTESQQESNFQESQKEELHQTTETPAPKLQSSTAEPQLKEAQEVLKEDEKTVTQFSLSQSSQSTELLESKQSETTQKPDIKQPQQSLTQTTQVFQSEETHRASSSPLFQQSITETTQPSTTVTQLTGLYLTQRPKFYQTLRPVFQKTAQSGFQRTRETESSTTTTEQTSQEPQEKRNGFTRLKYGKTTVFGTSNSEKSEDNKKVSEQQQKDKTLHTLEVRKYLRTKSREGAFSQFSKNKYFTSEKTEAIAPTNNEDNKEKESEEIATEREVETSSSEPKTTQAFVAHTDSLGVDDETTENDDESELQISTTEAISSSEEEESSEEDVTSLADTETTTEADVQTTIFQASSSDKPEKVTEPKDAIQTTEREEIQQTEYQPDIYRFSKNSFSFDETEKFTGTKNRAHVRNITTDIIENTASFSAPGIEKRPDIRVVTHRADEIFPTITESNSEITRNEKTEVVTTESSNQETTTDYPETTETESTVSSDAVTKAKVAKILKTSTTTKISHETEICYRGKCIRTKSENPDEDLKLLVDSASTMKIEKTKT